MGSLQRRMRRARDQMVRKNRVSLSAPAKPANKPDKGKLNGACNRTDCQRPGATWFNTSTRAYYCVECALDITNFAKRADGFHICFPTTGDAAEDAKVKFGKMPGDAEDRPDGLKPDKGKKDGSCNRTACQRPLAMESEHQFMEAPFTAGERLYYCAYCAITFDRVDADNRRSGASVLPNRITREPKMCEEA